MEQLKKWLEDLTQVPSISGFEEELSELITSLIKENVDSVEKDRLGNIIAFKKGHGKERLSILFEAHIDQIGLMVTRIEKNGIIKFTDVGTVNPQTLFGKRVKIFGKKEVDGIIGIKPPHLTPEEERSRVDPIDNLFIDTGYSSQQEVEKLIQPGDVALLHFYTDSLLNDHFASAGLDNKAGVLTLISLSELLAKIMNYHDIYLMFSVQEEVGARGAKVGGYTINPDVAVVCDVTVGDPVENKNDINTAKGPVVAKGPNFYPPLVQKICEIARQEDIPFQEEIEPRPEGTDAYYLQITRGGVYTAGLYIALRYMHSQVEVINVKDVYRAAKIMSHLTTEKNLLPIADQ